jgi:hypothetical protein
MDVYANFSSVFGSYKWDSSINENILGYHDRSIEFIPEIQTRRHIQDNGIGYVHLFKIRPWMELSLVRQYSGKPHHGIIIPHWLK